MLFRSHSTDAYRKTVWQCNHRYDGERRCSTSHLEETRIKSSFVNAVNVLIKEKGWEQKIYEILSNAGIDCVMEDQKQIYSVFHEEDWYSLVASATVLGRKSIRFVFKDGTEIGCRDVEIEDSNRRCPV